jgi:hypothetical protein
MLVSTEWRKSSITLSHYLYTICIQNWMECSPYSNSQCHQWCTLQHKIKLNQKTREMKNKLMKVLHIEFQKYLFTVLWGI